MVGQEKNSEALESRITTAVLPHLAAQGFEVVQIEYVPRSRVLRLFIDRVGATQEGAVGLDDCTAVTRWMSDFLDAEGFSDRIPGSYTLEVSSPGLDRPLTQPSHFVRFVGREVTVVLTLAPASDKGRRKYRGKLVGADAEASGGIRLEVEGRVVESTYAGIERANLVPDL